MNLVLEKFSKIQADIKASSTTFKNYPSIIAVSKTYPFDYIKPLVDIGHIHFGENKVQEADSKWRSIKNKNNKIQLHMLGKLQTNKAKKAIQIFDYIHSLDNQKLADILKKNEIESGKKIKYFIQVNFAQEKQKSGISLAESVPFFKYCSGELKLNIVGLMCFPPFNSDSIKYFKQALDLNKQLGLNELSMGMSNDYHEAIKFGSTFLRIGTAIFGKREN